MIALRINLIKLINWHQKIQKERSRTLKNEGQIIFFASDVLRVSIYKL